MKRLSLIFLLTLAACGGGGGSSTVPVPDMSTPAPQLDAFISLVFGLVTAPSETTEPIAVDTLVPPVPENTEPTTF